MKPDRRRGRASGAVLWASCLLACGLAVFPLASALGWGLSPLQADETILAWMGKRTLEGAVPYRDCLTFIPPLIPWGIATWFKGFGASLASLRLLQLAFGSLISALLCANLMQRGLRPVPATAASLSFAWMAFAIWPYPSHHYAATFFALAALLAAGPPEGEMGAGRALLSGAMGGLSGMALQTEGALVLGWLMLRPMGHRGWRSRLAVVLGALIPVTAGFSFLALQGALAPALRSLVLQPLLYYRQSGGFNDVSLWGSCKSWFGLRWPGAASFTDRAFLVGTALVLFTLPLTLLAQAARAAWHRDGPGGLALLRCLLLCAVAMGGRADVVHVAFFFPYALLSLAEEWPVSRKREAVGRVAAPFWGTLLLLVGGICWGGRWSSGTLPWPPDLRGADRWLRNSGPATVLKEIPGAAADTPLLALPYGSFVYLAHAPDPPPVDWLFPSTSRSNAPWEYASLAEWMDSHRPPYVLLNLGYEQKFPKDPSPVGRALARDYVPLKATRWGALWVRRGAHGPAGKNSPRYLQRPP